MNKDFIYRAISIVLAIVCFLMIFPIKSCINKNKNKNNSDQKDVTAINQEIDRNENNDKKASSLIDDKDSSLTVKKKEFNEYAGTPLEKKTYNVTLTDSVEMKKLSFVAETTGSTFLWTTKISDDGTVRLSIKDENGKELDYSSMETEGNGHYFETIKGKSYTIEISKISDNAKVTIVRYVAKDTADVSKYTRVKDKMEHLQQKLEYQFKPTEDGIYGIKINSLGHNQIVDFDVFENTDNRDSVLRYDSSTNEFYFDAKKGKIYIIVAFQSENLGEFSFDIIYQTPLIDITNYKQVNDRLSFYCQENAYKFKAGKSKKYKFYVSNLERDFRINMCLCDSSGETIMDISDCSLDSELEVELEENREYILEVTSYKGLGEYSIKAK